MWVPPIIVPQSSPSTYKCPQCEMPLRNTPNDHNLHHTYGDECKLCHELFCVEHGMDRRHPEHPSYCRPGEW